MRNNETPRATKMTAAKNSEKPMGQKQETDMPRPKQMVHMLRH